MATSLSKDVLTLQYLEAIIQRSHLERGRRVCEVENLDMTLCGANYHERVRNVERVATLWQLYS